MYYDITVRIKNNREEKMRFSVNLDRSMKESLPSPPGFDLSVQDVSLRNIGDSVKNENKAELA